MAGIKYGDCSPAVEDLQKRLSKDFGYRIPVTGEMDDATVEAVNDLKAKIGIKNSSQDVSSATLSAIDEAAKPRRLVTVNGSKAYVTAEQLAALQAKAKVQAAAAIKPYVQMAAEVERLWQANDKVRSKNWFWSRAVDLATGASFPSKSIISAATSAAKSIQADAVALKLDGKALGARSAPIRTAFAAMDQYRSETFGGGDELVKNLVVIREAAATTLTITAAVATGGASWKIQTGVSAGVAAYNQVLKEVDTASTTSNYKVSGGLERTFTAAAVEGAVGLVMKGSKLGKYMDDVADKAIKKAGSSKLKAWAVKAVNGGGQQMIEDGIKGIGGLGQTSKPITFDNLVDAGANSFFKGAGLKILGPAVEKYGKKVGSHFSMKDFKGLGKIDLDKAGEAAVLQAIDKIGPNVADEVLKTWLPTDNATTYEPEVRHKILTHPHVKKALDQAKKQKKK